ncbi:hypothetical protein RRG08_043862 [Elysia crispata]|uniref:Uncharacterized protein n=1 Tax=Elysia crispata TaxID=231223 RepID=A0AAE1CMM1_9GAST|nr:hypothetical protein RRG08_043862 [Elysia crispata]
MSLLEFGGGGWQSRRAGDDHRKRINQSRRADHTMGDQRQGSPPQSGRRKQGQSAQRTDHRRGMTTTVQYGARALDSATRGITKYRKVTKT